MKRTLTPAAVAAAALALAGCGTTTTVTVAHPSASPKVSASTAAQTPEQKLLAWKNGPGWSAFTTLDKQLTTTRSALKKDGPTPAAAAQCTNLAGDAQAAEPFPPPVATSDYMKAVKAYESAGTLAPRAWRAATQAISWPPLPTSMSPRSSLARSSQRSKP